MSLEVREGYDLKLRGRVSRYRLVRFGPFPEQEVGDDELIVHRHHPRTMRPQGRQLKVGLREVEALCTGLAEDGSGPLWSQIASWYELPRMPGSRYAVLAPASREQQEARRRANILHDQEA